MIDLAYAVRVHVPRKEAGAEPVERWLSSAMWRRTCIDLRKAALFETAGEAVETAGKFGLTPIAVAAIGVAELEELKP